MADTTVNIPEPSNEDVLALRRAGGDWKLVWDKNAKVWKVSKASKIPSYEIIWEDWQKGEKSYVIPDPNKAAVPEDIQAKTKAVEDPLADTVERYKLRVVTDPQTNRTTLKGFTYNAQTGKTGTEAVPFYIYLDSKNKINISEDYDSIKNTAIKDMQATGQINTLFQDLYNRKLISKATYNSKDTAAQDFNAALVDVINNYSTTVINNRQLGIAKEAPNFLAYLKGVGGAGTGVDIADLPRREFQDIGEAELNSFIDKIYIETIGRKPTEEQRKAKLKELTGIVKKGILSTRKVVGGEVQYKQTGGFSEQKQGAELEAQLKQENPLEYQRRQAFEFMGQLQKVMTGGM